MHGPADAPGAIGHARAYEVLSAVVFAGRRRRTFGRLVAFAGVRAGDRVLDVGCGTGYLTSMAARAGGRAVGVDLSEPMVARARRLRRDCAFEVGRAEALPFADGEFDVVVSSLAVHHLPAASRGVAFREAFRVLRPGGRVMVADFTPPKGVLSRHVVGATAGPAMRDNPVERIEPMLVEAGFTGPAVTAVGFLHCVRAVKPE
ncbi:hypothetical protein GCM10010492_65420 [Saccharothrix mutabilis subsp. mutabilis]|uniref:Methyltransferase type 11 domain-containing protein n=2 Tax=Saccharothrix mutabilis TaxID=33921 RepID=A0ABN0UMI1_9PSEU